MTLLSHYSNLYPEAGCDEAGRGCLAGPVFAAAVILPAGFEHPVLDDSKKLSESKRNLLREFIEQHALDWKVASVGPEEIDEINILNASILAMNKAIAGLKTKPAFLIIDGNRFHSRKKIPFQCIVKGDGKYTSIAAASVLAKTHRDEYMMKIHRDFPGYCWSENKGYPTLAHKRAIAAYGTSPHHRLTFNMEEQLRLQL